MMIYLTGLVGFLLALTAEAKVGNSSKVPFCTETEQCLLFTETCKNNCYETRHYDSFKLVSTETSWPMWLTLYSSFRRLHAYIKGDNEDGVKVQMVSPVIIRTEQGTKSKKTTMSFVLPAELQANPPKPSDDNIFIEELKDVTVFVKTFGGWINPWSVARNLESLSKCLKSDSETFTSEYYYITGYNSPMTIRNRHNEVWFVANGKPKCSSQN